MELPKQDEFRNYLQLGQEIWLHVAQRDGTTRKYEGVRFQGYYAAADKNFMILDRIEGSGRKAQIIATFAIGVDDITSIGPAVINT